MTSDLSVPAPQPNPSAGDDFAAVDRYIAGREDASGIADELVRRYGGSGRAVELPGTLGGDDRLPADDDAAPVVPSARVDLNLDQIEARANAATPGPWLASPDNARGFYGEDAYDVHAARDDGNIAIAQGGPLEDGGPDVGACDKADAEFIAHARSDVPRLVAEVRRLREETEKWRDRMTEHSDCEHRNAAELRRLHAEADSLRRQLLSETYRPEGGEIVMRELGIVKRERDAARAEAEHLKLTVAALGKDRQRRIAEAARVREALQAIRDRARSEIADAKEGEHYHAEVNNGAGLATEQSRRRAWEAVVRALDAALDGSE